MSKAKKVTEPKVEKKEPRYYFCECWSQGYYYFIGWTREEMNDFLMDHYMMEMNIPNSQGATLAMGDGNIFIWLINVPKTPKDLSVLAHECVHAANRTLLHRNYTLTLDNDEPQAYLMDSIFKKGLDACMTLKKKRSRDVTPK